MARQVTSIVAFHFMKRRLKTSFLKNRPVFELLWILESMLIWREVGTNVPDEETKQYFTQKAWHSANVPGKQNVSMTFYPTKKLINGWETGRSKMNRYARHWLRSGTSSLTQFRPGLPRCCHSTITPNCIPRNPPPGLLLSWDWELKQKLALSGIPTLV